MDSNDPRWLLVAFLLSFVIAGIFIFFEERKKNREESERQRLINEADTKQKRIE